MRLKKISDPSKALEKYNPDDLVIQEKIDGFKAMASKDDEVKLYTRRGNEFQNNVPKLKQKLESKLPKDTTILGELSYIDEHGKQDVTTVQSIVGSAPARAIELQEQLPGHIVYYVYDLLEYKGKNITKKPFVERDKLLRKILKSDSIIKFLKNYKWGDYKKAIDEALKKGGEGIVIKPKDSPYVYKPKGSNEPFGQWFKYKPGAKAHVDEVFVDSYTLGKPDDKGYRKAVFPAYQYKNGKPFEVGKLSGLPRDVEKEVKEKVDKGKKVIIEVSYQERLPSGKFRHMGWIRLRLDKPLKSVTMEAKMRPRRKFDRKQRWMRQFDDLVRKIDYTITQRQDYWDTATYLFFQDLSPEEAADRILKQAGLTGYYLDELKSNYTDRKKEAEMNPGDRFDIEMLLDAGFNEDDIADLMEADRLIDEGIIENMDDLQAFLGYGRFNRDMLKDTFELPD